MTLFQRQYDVLLPSVNLTPSRRTDVHKMSFWKLPAGNPSCISFADSWCKTEYPQVSLHLLCIVLHSLKYSKLQIWQKSIVYYKFCHSSKIIKMPVHAQELNDHSCTFCLQCSRAFYTSFKPAQVNVLPPTSWLVLTIYPLLKFSFRGVARPNTVFCDTKMNIQGRSLRYKDEYSREITEI